MAASPAPWRTATITSTLESTNSRNRSGAFVPVIVKTNLRRSPQPISTSNLVAASSISTSQQPQRPQGAKSNFPDDMKQYVARTFEDQGQATDKSSMERELKNIISAAFEKKVVWTTDWTQMPLPQEFILKRRREGKVEYNFPLKGDSSVGTEFSYSRLDTITSRDLPRSPSDSPDSDNSKKRKLTKNESENPLEKRIRHDEINPSFKLSDKLGKRYRRYQDEGTNPWTPNAWSQTVVEDGVPLGPVVGLSEVLEKRYLRLTDAPNPMNVRPLWVLEKTFELLKEKWRHDADYNYICDQFKSMRQDLTVQHIKNEFTVKVYELHARIALEKGDLGEYNQCQAQLFSLYREVPSSGHPEEFKAYRILYLLYTANRHDMNEMLANLTSLEKQSKNIKHALLVRAAHAFGNFHRFFRLYLEAPAMGGYLMDSFIERERCIALATIGKGFARSDLDMRYLSDELGFESDADCVKFLVDHGAQAYVSENKGKAVFKSNKESLSVFEARRDEMLRKIDIKGQM